MYDSYRELQGVEILTWLKDLPDVALAVDTETTGLHATVPFNKGPAHDRCIGVSIAGVWPDGRAFSHYYAVAHQTGKNVSSDTAALLWDVLLTNTRKLVFANVQFDILSLETFDPRRLDGTDFYDIVAIANLCNENEPINKSLNSLAAFYLKDVPGKVEDEFVEAQKKSGNKAITPEQMWDYAVRDAELTRQVWEKLREHPVWTSELPDWYWGHKQDLIRVLLAMRRRGVRIDKELASEYKAKGVLEQKKLAADLGYPAQPRKATKMHPFPDPDPMPVFGPKALEDLFVHRLGLPVVKLTPGGKPCFDKEAMEQYDLLLDKAGSSEAGMVKAYRGWQKAVSASYSPYLELVDKDGRLRCSYKLHGTKTGRLSCAEPNLQQIPKSTDKPWNGKMKECFIAQDGYTLVNADFSQLELRLGTAYADEESLKRVFEEGRDIFTEMSEEMGWARHDTKTFVYSVQYGAGVKRIMAAFGVTKPQATLMLRKYYSTYPKFKALADRITATAERSMKVRLWSGRYRHLKYASEGYKMMNSVIQGGAADIVEKVMIRCFKELDSDDCRMLLQVHDSITFEVRSDLVADYIPRIKDVMEDVAGTLGQDLFKLRFAVDVGYWSDREAAKHE